MVLNTNQIGLNISYLSYFIGYNLSHRTWCKR